MSSSRHRTAIIAFGMVFAVLLANALISYLNIRRLRETDGSVRHTYDVITALGEVQSTVLEAETGQRGYLLTEDARFLKPYEDALAQVDQRLQTLRELVSDNPAQVANRDELQDLVQNRLNILAFVLNLQKTKGAKAASSDLVAGKGRLAMERVRAKLNYMERAERQLLSVRNRESETAYWTAVVAGAISTLLGLLLAIAGYILVLRDIQIRNRATADLQAANERLEDRVRERTQTVSKMVETLRAEIEVRSAAEVAARHFADELQRSNRELEQFAAVASHDLQEPLRKIQAFADRLQSHSHEQLGEKGQDYLDRILNSASRMRRLIDDLLAYSRVASKGLAFTTVHLNQIVREVTGDLEIRLQQSGGRVECGELPSVLADPMQMRQLFQNLLANSLKFHRPDFPPQIIISGETVSHFQNSNGETEQGLPVQVTIRDNGIGFEPAYREQIFDLFQRLHGRDQYEGTGIGLAICKKIMERHGGTISAESKPGEGATFTLTLPLPDIEKGEAS
ncbi:MAG: sensor histidine kinase [Pirellulaceae bacterium]